MKATVDGTCTITGIGICTDKDLVIPTESPDGDTVTLIEKYALYSLKDVDSVTLINYNYEIDENAFQYGEFTAVNIIGGNPIINKSAFSSCEDLVSISFSDCNIQADEYAFYSCEDLTNVTICENGKADNEIKVDDSAFQYCKKLETVIIGNGTIEIGKYVFSGCAGNLAITIAGKNYNADAIKEGLK